jgi:hypothetical protein
MNSATGGTGIDRINWIADVLFVLVSDELTAAFPDNLVSY